MLTTKKLDELREVVNLKALCRLCDVNYYTVKNKTLAFRENHEKGQLSEKESNELKKSLEAKGLKLGSGRIQNSSNRRITR